jgi:hypothetical protein
MIEYACAIWSSATGSHVRKLHVLQSKRLLIATNAPLNVSNTQIHKNVRLPFFTDHIRALTEA